MALHGGDTDGALAALRPLPEFIAIAIAIAIARTRNDTDFPRLNEPSPPDIRPYRAPSTRASGWLVLARTALMEQAGAISDSPLRHGFLHNLPPCRETLASSTASVSQNST